MKRFLLYISAISLGMLLLITPSSSANIAKSTVKETTTIPEAKKIEPQVELPITPCGSIEQLATKYSDWSPTIMMNIADAETHCNWSEIGDLNITFIQNGSTYGMSCGAWQIRIFPTRPACEDLKDPEIAVDWAHKIYLEQGYSAWSVCNNGRAQCY